MAEFSRNGSAADRIAEAMRYVASALTSLSAAEAQDKRRKAGFWIGRAVGSLKRGPCRRTYSPAERARLAATHAILEDALTSLKRR